LRSGRPDNPELSGRGHGSRAEKITAASVYRFCDFGSAHGEFPFVMATLYYWRRLITIIQDGLLVIVHSCLAFEILSTSGYLPARC
jgi:hypothetical protein